MGDHSAFFYGTLMAPQVLHRVCHGPSNPTFTSNTTYLHTSPAILHNHRRHRVKGADYPAILPHPSSTVRGTYVTGLTDGDLYRLDIFEGDEYERRKVTVKILTQEGDAETGDGNVESEDEVRAETYIWIAGKGRLEDREWDFKEFQREKMRFWVGSSEEAQKEYREVDEAVRDGTGGRGANGHITTVLEKKREKERENGGGVGEPIKSAV